MIEVKQLIVGARKAFLTHKLMQEFTKQVTDGGQHGAFLSIIKLANNDFKNKEEELYRRTRDFILGELCKDKEVQSFFNRKDLPIDPTLREKTLFQLMLDIIVDILVGRSKIFELNLVPEAEEEINSAPLWRILPESIDAHWYVKQKGKVLRFQLKEGWLPE